MSSEFLDSFFKLNLRKDTENDFCKDVFCCGIRLKDLHQLFLHGEVFHRHDFLDYKLLSFLDSSPSSPSSEKTQLVSLSDVCNYNSQIDSSLDSESDTDAKIEIKLGVLETPIYFSQKKRGRPLGWRKCEQAIPRLRLRLPYDENEGIPSPPVSVEDSVIQTLPDHKNAVKVNKKVGRPRGRPSTKKIMRPNIAAANNTVKRGRGRPRKMKLDENASVQILLNDCSDFCHVGVKRLNDQVDNDHITQFDKKRKLNIPDDLESLDNREECDDREVCFLIFLDNLPLTIARENLALYHHIHLKLQQHQLKFSEDKKRLFCNLPVKNSNALLQSFLVLAYSNAKKRGSICSSVASPKFISNESQSIAKFPESISNPKDISPNTPIVPKFIDYSNSDSLPPLLYPLNPPLCNSRRLRLGLLAITPEGSNEKRFVCPSCGKDYKNANGVKYHINHFHHDGAGIPLILYSGALECTEILQLDFGDIEDELTDGERPYNCFFDNCCDSFKTLSGLGVILLTLVPSYQYSCVLVSCKRNLLIVCIIAFKGVV